MEERREERKGGEREEKDWKDCAYTLRSAKAAGLPTDGQCRGREDEADYNGQVVYVSSNEKVEEERDAVSSGRAWNIDAIATTAK